MEYCLRCNQPLNSKQKFYGQHPDCFEQIFKVKPGTEFHSLARKNSESDRGENSEKNNPHLTSYFAGNYKKYEGKLGEHSYILKLSKEEYPELAAVEYLCNKIGYYCGIQVAAPFTLIELEKNELAFVSRNFMHDAGSHASLNAIYHYIESGHTNYNVENVSRAIFTETRSVADVQMFFKTILFDSLIGNHDRHGRNFSLIETSKHKRLSPIYDNPSSLGLESGAMLKANFSFYGKIWTKDSEKPEILEYAKEIERLNAGKIVKNFLGAIQIDKITQTINEAHCITENMKYALNRIVTSQYGKLKNYVHP